MSATSPALSPEEIASGLKSDEYEEIVRRLGVIPIKQSWECSAACGPSIAATKLTPLLKQFPTTARILVGTREKNVVVDLGDLDCDCV